METPKGNLVAGMKWLPGAYTQRYNSRHKLFGHLFQGRYKAVLVEGQGSNYFQVVSTYIHPAHPPKPFARWGLNCIHALHEGTV